jgi:hypothetical protein
LEQYYEFINSNKKGYVCVVDMNVIAYQYRAFNKLTENYVVSNAKIKKAIKKELPLSIKEGIIKTITSF